MAAFTGVGDHYTGRLVMTAGEDSWTEKYPFKPGFTPVQARTSLGLIIAARAPLMGYECTIDRAVVTFSDAERDRLPATVGATTWYNKVLLDAEIAVESINSSGDGLDFRFEVGNGQFSTRALKGIRDGWVVGGFLTLTLPAPYPAPVGPYLADGPVAPATASEVALNNYLSRVRDYCALYVFNPATNLYDGGTYDSWIYRKVTRRRVGGSFQFGRGAKRKYT